MKNAIALGTFDGVHKGHRKVLDLPDDCRKIVITFSSPPKALLLGKNELITNLKTKIELLKNIGIEEIEILDFNKVKDMTPIEFLDFIYKKYSPSLISCGFNYRFGKNGQGDTELLGEYCNQKGIAFKCCEPVTETDKPISSTLIREFIKNGEIEKANLLLTRPFSFKANVISGQKKGRTIGFPTVNQKYPTDLVLAKFGVYKSKVFVFDKEYYGITYIGKRPSFGSEYVISETYIKDFSGDLYGQEVKISLLKYLREEMKFSSFEELKNQVKMDLKIEG